MEHHRARGGAEHTGNGGPAVSALQVRYVAPAELTPFEQNPRTMSAAGLEKLRRSILEYGFTAPILAQEGTGQVIAGHQRLRAAILAGLAEVPVVFLPLDDAKARAYTIADNRLAQESEWDFGELRGLLEELEGIDMNLLGFDEDEVVRALGFSEADATDTFTLPAGEAPPFQAMTFLLADEQAAAVKRALALAKKGGAAETFGNANTNGNALYKVVLEWAASQQQKT
jgi:ParB-like chromosome segregation protein Spo0J